MNDIANWIHLISCLQLCILDKELSSMSFRIKGKDTNVNFTVKGFPFLTSKRYLKGYQVGIPNF